MNNRELPRLYTPEITVRRSRLLVVNLDTPVTVLEDTAGNHALSDGNHRSFKAWERGIKEPERIIIGKIRKDVSQDPNFRPISALKVIEDQS